MAVAEIPLYLSEVLLKRRAPSERGRRRGRPPKAHLSRAGRLYLASFGFLGVLATVGGAWYVEGRLDSVEEVASRDEFAFPGEFTVIFGPVNDPSALFPNGQPSTWAANAPESSFQERMQWIQENDGVLASNVFVGLHFGPTEKNTTVLVRDVRVRRTECRPSLDGFLDKGAGAGDTFGRTITVDLDDPDTSMARGSDGTSPDGVRPPVPSDWRFPLYVNAAESDAVAVIVQANRGYYRFAVEVDIEHEGRLATLTFDESSTGEEFEITGSAGATSWHLSMWGQETMVESSTPPLPEQSFSDRVDC